MERKRDDSPPVALTIGESARRLKVSQMTIRRLLERGELSRVTIGRAVRVLARSVDELAERGGCRGANSTKTDSPMWLSRSEAARLLGVKRVK